MTAIAGIPRLLKQEVEYLRAEVDRLRAAVLIASLGASARDAEVERLRARITELEADCGIHYGSALTAEDPKP